MAVLDDDAGGGSVTLTLNSLSSSDSDTSSPYQSDAGVRLLTDGDVQERLFGGSWASQNSGTEWIDDGGSTASDYEAKIEKTSGVLTALLTGWSALNTYHDVDTTLQADVSSTVVGLRTWNGSITIREKADTGNSVNASVTMTVENGTLGPEEP